MKPEPYREQTQPTYKERVLRSLRELPNVGESIALDLWNLGIRAPEDLRGKNPETMYEELCQQQGAHVDRCMLYVFRALVYVTSTDEVDPAKKVWWRWKDATPPKRRSGRK